MNELIIINTKYGEFRNVPDTDWNALKPFWPDIISSIIETILENPFTIQDFRVKKGRGFIAAEYYWKKYGFKSKQNPLSEAIAFINVLKTKPQFVTAIKQFNSSKGNDWLKEENIFTLARFIRSICLPILPLLRSIQKTRIKKLVRI